MARSFVSKQSVGSLGTGAVALMLGMGALPASAQMPAPPMPPQASAERVLLREYFEQYSPYWRQVRGHWAVTSGRLLQTRDDARERNTVLFYDPLIIADAEITAVAAMLNDVPQFLTADDADLLRTRRQIGGAGIVFRYQDDNNQAQWFELAELPDVGETLARRIVESRTIAGPFKDHNDLRRVRGIGPLTLEKIQPYLLPLPSQQNVAGDPSTNNEPAL